MKKKDQNKLASLTRKWQSTKSKLQQLQAKEQDLRKQMEIILSQNNIERTVILSDVAKVTLTRKNNYSIPKSAIADIKDNLSDELFRETFSTSYRLKVSTYDNLTGSNKEVITKHLTIKPSPLSITVKEEI